MSRHLDIISDYKAQEEAQARRVADLEAENARLKEINNDLLAALNQARAMLARCDGYLQASGHMEFSIKVSDTLEAIRPAIAKARGEA